MSHQTKHITDETNKGVCAYGTNSFLFEKEATMKRLNKVLATVLASTMMATMVAGCAAGSGSGAAGGSGSDSKVIKIGSVHPLTGN